jgi:hypothetical protein
VWGEAAANRRVWWLMGGGWGNAGPNHKQLLGGNSTSGLGRLDLVLIPRGGSGNRQQTRRSRLWYEVGRTFTATVGQHVRPNYVLGLPFGAPNLQHRVHFLELPKNIHLILEICHLLELGLFFLPLVP